MRMRRRNCGGHESVLLHQLRDEPADRVQYLFLLPFLFHKQVVICMQQQSVSIYLESRRHFRDRERNMSGGGTRVPACMCLCVGKRRSFPFYTPGFGW